MNKIQIFLDLFEWWMPEVDLGSCVYETVTGSNPVAQAKQYAKNLVLSAFSKMRSAINTPPQPASPSYFEPELYPPQFESHQQAVPPTFDTTSASYYVRRQDILRQNVPTIQSSPSYSRVRKARQHWEKDQYFEHWHKPVYVVHQPEPIYEFQGPPEDNVPLQPAAPQFPLLKEDWIDYYENLILSKFGLAERLKEADYINCAQSYSFNIALRITQQMLSSLLSRIL